MKISVIGCGRWGSFLAWYLDKSGHEAVSYTHLICKGLLLRIFRILSTEYEFSLSKEQRKTINWIVFEEITDYIAAHYSHITLSDLTEQFHFQEDYFNRLIKDKTGLTYSKYVQQVRLEKDVYKRQTVLLISRSVTASRLTTVPINSLSAP